MYITWRHGDMAMGNIGYICNINVYNVCNVCTRTTVIYIVLVGHTIHNIIYIY